MQQQIRELRSVQTASGHVHLCFSIKLIIRTMHSLYMLYFNVAISGFQLIFTPTDCNNIPFCSMYRACTSINHDGQNEEYTVNAQEPICNLPKTMRYLQIPIKLVT